MPKRLDLSAKDKRDLRRRYARGETAADLVASRKDLGLSLAQIQNLICREKWSAMKGAVVQVRRRAASEVLAQVREEAGDELVTILHSVKRGIKNDAVLLEDGRQFVETAADLSSLQRAKNLHLGRTLKLFGLDAKPDAHAARGAAAAFVFMRFPEAAGTTGGDAVVNVTGTAAGEAEPTDGELNLDFDDDEHDTARPE